MTGAAREEWERPSRIEADADMAFEVERAAARRPRLPRPPVPNIDLIPALERLVAAKRAREARP